MLATIHRYYRRVIRIRAQDSPNVRRAEEAIARGERPDGAVVTPGVITWDQYQERRATWDAHRQAIGLDAEFPEGADVLLFPVAWLDRAAEIAARLEGKRREGRRALGVDPAEGGDRTAWVVVDELGVLEVISRLTPNTADVTGETLAIMRRWDVQPERVAFDAGGGGKQHADRLRAQGFPVRAVRFGESITLEIKYGTHQMRDRREQREDRYVYVNRRAEMFHELSLLFDPANPERARLFGDGTAGFGLPARFAELRRQLAPFPKMLGDWSMYDGEGRIRMLPKSKPTPTHTGPTLIDLVGCSPDEADALALAVHALTHRATIRTTAGVIS